MAFEFPAGGRFRDPSHRYVDRAHHALLCNPRFRTCDQSAQIAFDGIRIGLGEVGIREPIIFRREQAWRQAMHVGGPERMTRPVDHIDPAMKLTVAPAVDEGN